MGAYVIVDLEMCGVPSGEKRDLFGWNSELIQIGAVLLDDSLEVIDSFKTFVAPQFGTVDAYIENLTGIKRSDTKDAPDTETALNAFVEWLPEDAVLVSWSKNDERQIIKEIEGKQLTIPGLDKYLESWEDCQKEFADRMDSSKCYKLSEALIICDIDQEDGEHDALVDAHNTALLFAKMKREPVLKLNRYYRTEEEVSKATYSPFAGLLGMFEDNE